jgi:hypothetical protein
LESQAYVLIKHVGLSFFDVCQLTFIERKIFLDFFKEETEKRKEEMKNIQAGKRR